MTINPVMVTFPRLQQQVHEMIVSVGGYWRPAAGVLRLLEELGELVELMPKQVDHERDGLAEELADIWIISTCTANQFLIDLSSVKPDRMDDSGSVTDQLHQLTAQAGQIARVINYYDGPKVPKSMEGLPSLAESIAGFHATLGQLAHRLGVPLDRSVETKLASSKARDVGRFSSSYDPSMAESVTSFETTLRETPCAFAPKSRIWGAPNWASDVQPERHVASFRPALVTFTKCAMPEGLDGFVVSSPANASPATVAELGAWFNQLLLAMVRLDPRGDLNLLQAPDRPGWQFLFNGLRMFVSAFSSLYPKNHPRHAAHGSYVLFQPEGSFTSHGIGAQFPGSSRIKQSIRRRFTRLGRDYPEKLIESRIEAHLYVLPLGFDDAPIRWWAGPTTAA